MSKMDWQAFDDGSISDEARQEAVERLKDDAAAHRELEGLKLFQKTIRQRCLEEQVPHDKLNGMLARVCGKPVRTRPAYVLPAVAVAACALGAFFIFRPKPEPIKFDTSPQLVAVSTHSPAAAADWVKKQSGIKVPVITLAGVSSRIEGARCGSCWMSYDYLVEGEKYTIYVKQSWHAFDKVNRSEFREGREFYVADDGIGWYCHGGMSYFVVGGDVDGRWKVALAACKETPKLGL